MTIKERRRLRISIASLGLFLASAVPAERAFGQALYCNDNASGCVTLTLNANVQVTKLHPLVGAIGVLCHAPIAPGYGLGPGSASGRRGVVNRGYAGIVISKMNVPRSMLNEQPAWRTLNVTCVLELYKGSEPDGVLAVASAGQPQGITSSNWNVVATSSTITWSQTVTFPSAP